MKDPKFSQGAILLGVFLLLQSMAHAASPFVNFTSPTNGQQTLNLIGLGGTAQAGTGSIQTITFSIRELDINGGPGRWWNGTNFQATVIALSAQVAGTNWLPTNSLPPLNSGQSYVLAATMTNTVSGNASTNINVQAPTNALVWDPGVSPAGTAVLLNPNTNGGNYWFKINPQSPASGVWRIALNVLSGEADLYLRQGTPPTTASFQFASQRVGSDGLVLDASQFTPGADWWVLVTASSNAQWNLVTGDVFVHNLGILATDSSSSTNATIGAEGMIFFKTTMPSNALAWRLWLNGATNTLLVKKSAAPNPVSYELSQGGQMLIVPPYLTATNSAGKNFFVRAGATGANNGLDWNNAWSDCASIVWGGGGVNAGDTVWFAGGTYSNTLAPTVSGTADAWINIKRVRATDFAATNVAGWNSAFDSQVIIQPSAHPVLFNVSGIKYICLDGRIDSGFKLMCPNSDDASVAIKQAADYITLTNLDLAGPAGPTPIFMNGDNRGIDGTAWNGSYYEPISHLLVTHCRIHGQVNNFWLINCYNSTIEYCKIYDSAAANFIEFHANVCAASSSTNITWRYNEIYNHQVEGIMFIFGGCANWYIYGNVWHDGMTGVSRVLEAQDGVEGPFYFYNNTIANVGTSISVANNGTYMAGSRGRNNIYWNTTVPGTPGFGQAYRGLPDNDYDFSNFIFSEPHGVTNGSNPFVSITNQDYHLISTVGATYPRNKGVALYSPFNVGFDGNVRGADGAWDISAYEYTAASSSSTNTAIPSGNPAAAYFIGVAGNPGTAINLDSRQQPVSDVAFGSATNVIVVPSSFPYVTYRIQVPQQSAWQLKLFPAMGLPSMVVRRGLVPNEFWNEASADSSTNAGAALTLTPKWWPSIPSLSAGTYFVTIYNATNFITTFTNGNPTLTSGLTNQVSANLADNERAYYQVNIPPLAFGAPVLGWRLDLTSTSGMATLRVRPGDWPDDLEGAGTSPYSTNGATIVPPYLAPGNWYVEVRGAGATSFTLNSSVITTNTLRHVLWVMPPVGGSSVAPGLSLPSVGDSGVDPAGLPLPGDQGIDLASNRIDYFAIIIPTNNAGLLRTDLDKFSGNPNLYLRNGAVPTRSHLEFGDYGAGLYDRSLTVTGAVSKSASWVPLNGKYETQLPSGMWLLAVEAGSTNARYRLRLTCGNPVVNNVVQDVSWDSGSVTNQVLFGGDWRYYRFVIPSNAPGWTINWSRSAGSARMFVRDTVPPGDGTFAEDYSNPAFNPGPWSDPKVQSLETHTSDAKNQGPYLRYDTPGAAALTIPPVRPGSVYYLGFWSPDATTFSFTSTSNGILNFTNSVPYDGSMTVKTIPAFGSLAYRIDIPLSATRLLLNVSNAPGVLFGLEQGSYARFGGPAHWTGSSSFLNLELDLSPANPWPWLPGYSYYLSVTNTTASSKNVSFALGRQFPAAPLQLQGNSIVDGNFRLFVAGQLGSYYIIQASTNLLEWEPLHTNTTFFEFIDLDATNYRTRFYRTKVLYP